MAPLVSRAAAPIQAPSGRVTNVPIRQEFKPDDYSYRFLGYEVKSHTGSPEYGEQAVERATFVVVKFKKRDIAKATRSVLAGDFRLADAQGRTFDVVRKMSPPGIEPGFKV